MLWVGSGKSTLTQTIFGIKSGLLLFLEDLNKSTCSTILHSIRNMAGSRMLASVLIWRWPFHSHLCLQVFWGQMFSPADSLFNKHIWALLLSVFSTEIWGSQKRLPRYLFLLSCNPWHPDDTVRCFWPGGIPYQKQSRKGEHPVLKPAVIMADPQKKSPDLLGFVAPKQFKRWPLETPGIIMFTVAPHMYQYWAKAKALKSMYKIQVHV